MNFLRKFFQRRKPELVRYYDASTKLAVLIPKAELRPGVILVRLQGESEPMYMDASELKQGPIQHSDLGDEFRMLVRQLAQDLAEVFPQSDEKWQEGFQRDRNPEEELAGWFHVAAILKLMTARHEYDLARKKECFRVLVACYTGSRNSVRDRSDPKLLSSSEVDETTRYFYEGGYGSAG
ncbi:MAG: hypothetical protein V4662_17295 [Verrucomicrobiota bacterium]